MLRQELLNCQISMALTTISNVITRYKINVVQNIILSVLVRKTMQLPLLDETFMLYLWNIDQIEIDRHSLNNFWIITIMII